MAVIDRRPGIRPRATVGRGLDLAARHAVPVSATVLLMLLTELPFGFAGQTVLLPALTIGCTWFWSVYRPSAMPPPAVFLMGVLLDLLGYLPLGVSVLTLLSVHAAATRWQHYLARQGVGIVWLAFAPVGVLAAALSWSLTALLSFRLLPVGPAMFQAVLSIALYPVLAIPLGHAHRGIANPDRV